MDRRRISMGIQNFFAELRRRRVVRVAVVYAVVAFVLVQVADLLVPALLLPDWVFRFVVLVLLLGFPVALVLAWAFDITPEGVVRAEGKAGLGAGIAFYGGLTVMVALGAGIFLLRFGPGPTAPPDEGWMEMPSVAVLPFVNMSPDPDQEHFSDGITEDLITHLSRIEGVRVPSRTSVMRFKGSDLPISRIARELGVTHVLEGSVRRDGDAVRINAQLIDAGRDAHLWADIYDRELTDIFRIQSEITQEISRALAQRLSPRDRSRIAEGETGDVTAYDHLLRGREHLRRPGAVDIRRYELASEHFRQALEVDPGYARTYAGLAEVFNQNVVLPTIPVRRDSIFFYARRALELDPDLPEAMTTLGFGYLYAQDWDRAEVQFRRALSYDRNQADAMEGLSRLAGIRGRLDEAARWRLQALSVDPLSPRRLDAAATLLFDLGDLDGAESLLRRGLTLAPDDPEAALRLAWVHWVRGNEEEGDRVMRRLTELADHDGVHTGAGYWEAARGRYASSEAHFARTPVSDLGAMGAIRAALYKVRGEDERARELITRSGAGLTEWTRQGLRVPPRYFLYRAVVNDDPEEVLEVLRTHWPTGLRILQDPPKVGLYWLDLDPALEPFRDDPRFRSFLGEMRAGLDSLRALVEEDRFF
jgi:adenylate cyclase